ncbi:MAG TPA: HDOD domain-containing protein [Chloroflexota bacterium]|nr:HDOD domain-containing protein [Chloroflexota bacterium]
MLKTGIEDPRAKADRWLHTVNNLPSFPPVVQEVLKFLDDKNSDAKTVAVLISKDAAISAKLLRLVNSAFYGLRGEVTTISHAVALLGLGQLRLLLVGVALLEQGRARNPHLDQARKILWEHSFACSNWAQELAKATRYTPVEEAAVASLLHDVGKIALSAADPKLLLQSIRQSFAEGVPSFEVEERLLGFNHIETGKMIADRWRLPQPVRTAIALHHHPWSIVPQTGEADPSRLKHLVAIVKVANQASKEGVTNQTLAEPTDSTIAITPEALIQNVYAVNNMLLG